MQQTIGDQGIGMIKAVKNYVDPTNVFASGNLIPSGDPKEDNESPAAHVKAKL